MIRAWTRGTLKMAPPLIQDLDDRFQAYLCDESGLTGHAGSISFPGSKDEIKRILAHVHEKNLPLTLQGSRTGLCGGAVPQGGHVLNLSKMNRITGLAKENPEEFLMTVEPGLQLTELNDQLENQTFDTSGWDPSALALLDEFHRSGPWFWPVNPGEVSATIGGIAAQNARGSFVTGYGEPHQFIQRVCLIDGRGKSHAISSGQYRVEKGIQALPDNQRIALGSSAEYATPPNGAPRDLLSIILGSEGNFGVISKITLRLIPKPDQIWGIAFSFDRTQDALSAVAAFSHGKTMVKGARIAGLEWLGNRTLDAIRRFRSQKKGPGLWPQFSPASQSMVLVEIHADKEGTMDAAAQALLEKAQTHHVDDDYTWAFCNRDEMARFKAIPHAAVESMNVKPGPMGKAPLSTQFLLELKFDPGQSTLVIEKIESTLLKETIEYHLWGMVGIGCVRLHVATQNETQYQKVCRIMADLEKDNLISVTAGYGRGRQNDFVQTCDRWHDALRRAQALKQFFDPAGILNPFESKEVLSHL